MKNKAKNSITNYLSESDRLIQFAKENIKSDPQKARSLLAAQLNQHIKLLERLIGKRGAHAS